MAFDVPKPCGITEAKNNRLTIQGVVWSTIWGRWLCISGCKGWSSTFSKPNFTVSVATWETLVSWGRNNSETRLVEVGLTVGVAVGLVVGLELGEDVGDDEGVEEGDNHRPHYLNPSRSI